MASDLRDLQNRFDIVMDNLRIKLVSSNVEIYYIYMEKMKEYHKLYRPFQLYPEDLDFIEKHGRHPSKNVKRLIISLKVGFNLFK